MKKLMLLPLLLMAGVSIAELTLDRPKEQKPSSILIDGVAAYVNSEFITISDVMNEVRRSPYAQKGQLGEKRLRQLYAATLISAAIVGITQNLFSRKKFPHIKDEIKCHIYAELLHLTVERGSSSPIPPTWCVPPQKYTTHQRP